MKRKKARLCLLCSAVIFISTLCGCNFPGISSSDSLMHPPKATGDKGEIQSAIDEYADTSYTLKYPQSGDNRSSITMKDLNSDETDEAVALLTINPDTDEAETHIYIIDEIDDNWKVVGDFKNKNNEVDRIEFGDMNGDGLTDILVGWGTYSINQNELYCYLFGNKIKEVNTKRTYSDLAVGNFTQENKNTVIAVSLATSEAAATGQLISIGEKDVVTAYEVTMDSDITKYTSVKAGLVDNDHTGVFVDGLNSQNKYNTQAVYFDTEKKKLMNPVFLYSDSGVLSTSRDTDTECQDINNDGIIDIPLTTKLPYPKGEDSKNYAYETRWSSFDTVSMGFITTDTVIINSNYNFSVDAPDEWIGNYTAIFNGDSSVLTLYKCTPLKNGQNCRLDKPVVAYIASLTENWTTLGTKKGYTKITDIGKYTYGYKTFDPTPYKLSKDTAVQIFIAKDDTSAMAVAPTEASK